MPTADVHVLLVEDDEDDVVVTDAMLRQAGPGRFALDWVQSYDDALAAIREDRHDVYLVDYRLGEHTGLEIVRDAWGSDPRSPVILLTGQEDHEVDVQASDLGVTDYLVKGTLDAPGLERAIRYAMRHHRVIVDLRRSEERYAVAVRATNDGIWDWDLAADRIHFSDRFRALLGYPDGTISDEPEAWFGLVHPDDVARLRREIELHRDGQSAYFENEHRIRHADGSWHWFLSRGLATRDAHGQPVRITGSISDITGRRTAEQRLIHDALHDGLTGLPNRALFLDRLDQCLRHLERDPGYTCAVLFLDVDRFKLVNDSVSHAAGDRLLIELARRVSAILRPSDTLARLGGDEFTILLDDVESPEQALDVAHRACAVIAEPLDFEGHELSVAASIGIAHNLDGVTDAEELIRNADIAMYDAKSRGGGLCAVFDTSMHRRVLARVSLEHELRQAIEQGTLRTFFQPIVDLRTGTLHGFEALARWPAGEIEVTPGEFIPVAEETGLIEPLGAFVLRAACGTLARWRAAALVADDVTISVNVSPRQLIDSGIVELVRESLDEADLPARCLVLEITESILIDNPALVGSILGRLVDVGVGVQLDDFGTGYSSLTVLHHFPGDTLKIDRAFVATVADRAQSDAIVRSIVGLAHSLGLHVIAEGIEDTGQLDALAGLSCEYGQGFIFSRPACVEETEAMLSAHLRFPVSRRAALRATG